MATVIEVWRPVLSHPLQYEVSSAGRVRSVDRVIVRSDGHQQRARGRVLRPSKSASGHLTVSLWRDNSKRSHYVHRLVAMAFIGPVPNGMEVCHNNGDPADNRASNLRYDTRSENVTDEVRAGRHWQTRKTHCKWGHEFTPENTRIRGVQRTQRVCVTCNKAAQLRYRDRHIGEIRERGRVNQARRRALLTGGERP